ncbi:hypothetical protein J4526_08530 [Desulfurococcaceae archaeon MEX13E-LK6-19]|nr:hypothetical protein J4526_08530 [Desulfurococcaceae archaeon MEX13E-LK6-19]
MSNTASSLQYELLEEANFVKTLNTISRIIAFIIFIIEVPYALFLFAITSHMLESSTSPPPFFFKGILFAIVLFMLASGIVNFIIFLGLGDVNNLIKRQEYKRARNATLIYMILGFVFSWILVGALLLIAYMKYDTLIRLHESISKQSSV